MCGRYASARSVEDLAVAFDVGADDVDGVVEPDWNVAPTKWVSVVLVRGDRRVLSTARWGLVPSWAPDPSVGTRMINARIETVADKPAFRDALAQRRCLLPADGWYEWSTRPDGTRQPHYLSRPGREVIAFAGLWERWLDAEGRPLVTTTILTGPAPEDLRALHDRAPVVMPADRWQQWLDPGTTSVAHLLTPTADNVVVAHPVGDAVGDVRAAGPALVEPVVVPEQPSLF